MLNEGDTVVVKKIHGRKTRKLGEYGRIIVLVGNLARVRFSDGRVDSYTVKDLEKWQSPA